MASTVKVHRYHSQSTSKFGCPQSKYIVGQNTRMIEHRGILEQRRNVKPQSKYIAPPKNHSQSTYLFKRGGGKQAEIVAL
jgi:hypothetical protein